MSPVHFIVKGFYAIRQDAQGLFCVYGEDMHGYPATIAGLLDGFSSSMEARKMVKAWVTTCEARGVHPFAHKGIVYLRQMIRSSTSAAQNRKAA